MAAERLRTERVRIDRLASADRAAWDGLLAQGHQFPAAFMSATYAEAVHRTVGPVQVLVAREQGRAVGFLPLQRLAGWPGRLGVHEPPGGVMTDYFGWVAQAGFAQPFASALRQAGVPCVYFTHLDQPQLDMGMPGDQPKTGLRTNFRGGAEAYWAELRERDRKLVSDTERRTKRLEREHGEIRFALDDPDPQGALEQLIALKLAQYARTGVRRPPLGVSGHRALLHALLPSTDPLCHGRISTLRIGGRLIAAHFGLQCQDVLHFWFPVYDEAYAAYSPGRILLRHVIQHGASAGIALIDRGVGDSPAKRDFANEEHRFYKGLVGAGPRGALARQGLRAGWRFGWA